MQPTIFPEPREVVYGDSMLVLSDGSRTVRVCEESPVPMGEAAHSRLRRAIEQLGGSMTMGGDLCGAIELVVQAPRVNLDHDQLLDVAGENSDQAYVIEVLEDRVRVTAWGGPGLVYAISTLIQLLQVCDGCITAPMVTIRDWPHMRYRGLFAESRWGMDLMTLDDWKDAIDYLVDLKYNVLTVGVYNCWPIQYDGDVSEWLMVRIPSLPQLTKEQHIRWYSQKQGDWQELRYLPKMFKDDFFGALVAYGASKGVIVRPHFNSPGHNSLIPRLIPEVSALDEQGQPTGYGFCLSNPATYTVMYQIMDDIIDNYLAPHGVKSYHIAADEVYPLVGMHPGKPYQRLSPWCKCPECNKKTEGELYVDYIEKIVTHLHQRGITMIGMWYDQLVRGGALNQDLAQRFDAAGLRDEVVLHWWDYGDFFETTHPELGFRRWVTPMTGYYYQTVYTGHLDNIYRAEHLGCTEDCEGTESYGVFDPAQHRHLCAQVEWSWNCAHGQTQEDFTVKYARYLFGEDWERGLEGLRHFSALVDNAVSARMGMVLFRYSYDYGQSEEQATARDNYPQLQVQSLANCTHQLSTQPLQVLAGRADRARALLDAAEWRNDRLRHIYLIECERYSAMARAAAAAAEAVRGYDEWRGRELSIAEMEKAAGVIGSSHERLLAALQCLDALFGHIENEREDYLQPHMLRELSFMRRFVVDLAAGLGVLGDGLKAQRLKVLPDLEVMRVNPVPWVG